MLPEITIGEPVTRGPLTLYPLFSDADPAPDYVLGAEATRKGLLVIEEIDGGTVPHLAVTTKTDATVLVVEGEMLVGARQNRTLNLSVLLPGRATTKVPVSCVEAGRWGAARPVVFSPRHAPPSLRRIKQESVAGAAVTGRARVSDQGAVWHAVEALVQDFDAYAPTAALEDVFDGSATRTAVIDLDDLRPATGQRGVVACFGGRARVADLFDKASTLEAQWASLLHGYALDAFRNRATETAPDAARAFVDDVRGAAWFPADAVGLGEEAHVRDGTVSGFALRWAGAVVHLSAFATGRSERAGSESSWFATRPARSRRAWFRSG